jgi:hypothetical protein
MKPMLKNVCVLLILTASMQSMAAVEFSGSECPPEVAQAYTQSMAEELENEKVRIAEEMNRKRQIEEASRNGAMATAMSCIDRLKNMSISGGLGVPNIMDAIMRQLNGMVCGAVDKVYSDANKTVNKSVSFPGVKGLPGTGGNGGIYVGSGPGGVSVNGQKQISTPGINSAFQTASPQQRPAVPAEQPGVWEKTKRALNNAF